MPTPIGHTLTGLALYGLSLGRPNQLPKNEKITLAALTILAANAPDLDFFYLENSQLHVSGLYHHGVTHSIGFAFIAGFLVWLAGKLTQYDNRLLAASFVSLAWMSHAIIDLFSYDSYPVNGIGVPILWPITDHYFILPFLPPVDRTAPFSSASLMALAIEILFFGALFLISRRIAK